MCTKFLLIWSTESWETQLLKEKTLNPEPQSGSLVVHSNAFCFKYRTWVSAVCVLMMTRASARAEKRVRASDASRLRMRPVSLHRDIFIGPLFFACIVTLSLLGFVVKGWAVDELKLHLCKYFHLKNVKSVSKVLGKIPKPAAPTLQEDLSQDLWDRRYQGVISVPYSADRKW